MGYIIYRFADRGIGRTVSYFNSLSPLPLSNQAFTIMAFNGPSLTPSRPAPAPPGRGANQMPNSTIPHAKSALESSFSSTSYSTSFPSIVSSTVKSATNIVFNKNAIVRSGAANVKEEGLKAFMWSKRWLVLRGSEFCIYKNEVRSCNMTGLFTGLLQ